MTNKTDHWYDVLFRDGNIFKGTVGLTLPNGTTGERPIAPIIGTIRYNSSLSIFEGYDGLAPWAPLTIAGGSLTTFDALTDTPPSKSGSNNAVLKVHDSGTTIDYSNVLIEPSGAVTVVAAYEGLVLDNVLTNGKYVDDAITAIGTGPFVSRATGGAMDSGINFEMGAAGQILADAGSAANPSYSFLGKLDTGIYAPVDDNVVVSTNGTPRVSFSNTATDILNTPLEMNNNNIADVDNIDANTYTASGVGAQFILPSYSKSSLPAGVLGGMIYVTDETGGAVPAFYDGANWLRVTDRAIVS